MALEKGLRLRELVEIVRVILDVPVGCYWEAAGAGGRVLDDLARLRLHQPDDAIDQRPRRKILARSGFFFGGVLFEKPFVEIAEPLPPGRVPVKLVDRVGERLEVCRLTQLRLRVAENREYDRILGLLRIAQVEQELAIVLQLLEPLAAGERLPAVTCGQTLLMAGLGQHLEKEQERQLRHIVGVRDAVVAQHVAEVPEFRDDLAGDAVAVGQAAVFHNSPLMSRRTASSCPPKTLLSRWNPPSFSNGSSSIEARSTTISRTICSSMRFSHLRCTSVHGRLLRIRCIADWTRVSNGIRASPIAACRTKPMIDAAMSTFLASAQARRSFVSV